MKIHHLMAGLLAAACLVTAQAQPALKANPQFDAEAAKRTGADSMGMRNYVLVVLKTSPNKVPAGKERDEMFAGHFANIKRLSEAGKLVLAGPSDGSEGWRGIFVFAVKDIEEARQLTATDPVIVKGEMVAEFHKLYASAALMDLVAAHNKLAEKVFQ